MTFPAIPDVGSEGTATARVPLRFEDISQDGRLVLEAMPTAMAVAVWGGVLTKHPLAKALRGTGLVPILSRLASEGERSPMSVGGELMARGVVQLAHGRGKDGEVSHIYLNTWAELTAPIGRTYGAPPDGAGERVVVGRVFGEHIFTRPFGDPSHRKVTRIEAEGVPSVPEAGYNPSAPTALLDLGSDVTPLGVALTPDTSPIVFGLCHTDSNQHVNSLVYPRLFEEAALRRFATLDRAPTVLARSLEIAFRKPAFAGDRMRVVLRAFEDSRGHLGAVGAFVREDEHGSPEAIASARPHAFVRMTFEA